LQYEGKSHQTSQLWWSICPGELKTDGLYHPYWNIWHQNYRLLRWMYWNDWCSATSQVCVWMSHKCSCNHAKTNLTDSESPSLDLKIYTTLRVELITQQALLLGCTNDGHTCICTFAWWREENFDVCCAITCTIVCIWYYALNVNFCINYANCMRLNILVGIKPITSYSHPDSLKIVFIWTHETQTLQWATMHSGRIFKGLMTKNILLLLI